MYPRSLGTKRSPSPKSLRSFFTIVMDDKNPFLSPEAFRSLGSHPMSSAPNLHWDPLHSEVTQSSVIAPYVSAPSYGPVRSPPTFPGSFTKFSATSGVSKPKHGRAKFTATRKAEVATVREKGVCMRCKLQKILVRGEVGP